MQVYTAWINHHLEKVGSTRQVTDLENDLRDGVLLAKCVELISMQ